MPESKERNDVESQTSPMKETSSKYQDPKRNHSLETNLGARQYRASMTPRKINLKSNDRKRI